MPQNLLTISGLSSVRAIAAYTPHLIERLFFDETHAPLFGETCKALAHARKIYRLVEVDELKKITDSSHHQGAAAVIELKASPALVATRISRSTLCLHGVENPHNVGAILRTAAFFGFEQVVLSRKSYSAAMTAAAWRVAEGGLTHVQLAVYDTEEELFQWSTEHSVRLLAAVKPEAKKMRTPGEFLRDKNATPVIICLGNEEEGLPPSFISRCSGRFSLQGSGKIESLNVSVTAAICLNTLSEKVR